ncbi:MAG: hypothetical protein LKE46_00030 [Clostridium sp.]|jgi:hypothetical protein|nr:hypothetical protein [Clostridium sp.]MCH3962654.1 hypothetical protein [Clostridium sp.]MCI2201040.1 hypothetical protein [Clostridium sp.]
MQEQYDAMHELILTIAESFGMSHADAEVYARKLKNMALDEYRKAFRK